MSALTKKQSDQERVLGRRKQVLDAAEFCFSRSGFHGASMAEISKTAGMSIGHIYNYFAGKDDIIAAFVQQNRERVSLKMDRLLLQEDPLQAMLDDVERSLAEDLRPGIWKLPLEIFAEAARNPKIAELVQDSDLQSRTLMMTVLTKGREKLGLSAEPVMLNGRLEAVISLFQGMHLRIIHNPTPNIEALTAAFRLALAALLLSP